MTTPADVLLGIIRLAGPEGRSSSELRLGCRCVAGQDCWRAWRHPALLCLRLIPWPMQGGAGGRRA
jgi:hypothetical protein